jgi:acyl-homoserine lactone acylase PvdQ
MYENHRGPVIENIFDELYYKYSYPLPLKYRINHTITCDSALYRPDSTSLKNLLDITFSLDYKHFENIGHLIKVPNIDSVYINKDGDFGYSAVGRNPVRNVYELSGFMKDGTVSDYDMKGFLNSNPRVKNPKKGYVAMCNNKYAPN